MHAKNYFLIILADAMISKYHSMFGMMPPFTFKNSAKYSVVAGTFLFRSIHQLLKASRTLTLCCIVSIYVVLFFQTKQWRQMLEMFEKPTYAIVCLGNIHSYQHALMMSRI